MNVNHIEGVYELSPVQEGILFQCLHEPDASHYHEQFFFTLNGAVDEEKFKQAWNECIDKHVILRTTFHWEEIGKLLQAVHRTIDYEFVTLDWSNIGDSTEAASLWEEFIITDRQQPFDLRSGCLMRMALIKLSHTKYRFLWSYHHLIMDGWSLAIVMKDVFAAYERLVEHRPLRQAGSVASYPEYIRWLQQRRRSDDGSAQRYWMERLATGPHQRIAVSSIDMQLRQHEWNSSTADDAVHPPNHVYEFEIGCDRKRAIHELAPRWQTTVSQLLITAWGFALSELFRSSDIMFGLVVSGRSIDLPGVLDIVGPMINTLPLRMQLCPDHTVSEVVRRTGEYVMELEEMSYIPLSDIQKWTRSSHDESLFETILTIQNYPFQYDRIIQMADIQVENIYGVERTPYPLSAVIIPTEQNIVLQLHVDQHVINAQQAERLGHGYIHILEKITEHPELLIGQLVHSLRSAGVSTIHEQSLFARSVVEQYVYQVSSQPNATAVMTSADELTYAELDRRSRAVRTLLLSHGLSKGDHVGVVADRSIEMIVMLLGVLRAGGVYVPIDPDYPAERTRYIIEDAGLHLIISRDEPAVAVGSDVRWLRYPHAMSRSDELPDIDCSLDPNDDAYIMYTSGSTGQPKGVVVQHGPLASHIASFNETFHIQAEDRILQFSSPCFDPSIEQIFSALVSGATIYVRDQEVWDAHTLTDTLLKHRITVANLPTGYWNQITTSYARQQEKVHLPHLRYMLVGGDKMAPHMAEAWLRCVSEQTKLVNLYGPTENVVTSAYYLVESEHLREDRGSMPIGRPLNRHLYILDEDGYPTPDGSIGELYIGGVHVARAYVGRPSMTAASFVPDPYHDKPGAIMYRTGDLVRRSSDGLIQFVGRADDQLKVRGYRVEPGEIESAIAQLDSVQDVSVIAQADASGELELIACVEAGSANVSEEDVLKMLRHRLPSYMVPKTVRLLEQFPLTPNGKVDKKALLHIVTSSSSDRQTVMELSEPMTEQQAILLNIWREVLGDSKIGITDHYVEIGGDSILAIQICSRARQHGIPITTKLIFEYQTIERITQHLPEESREHDGWHFTEHDEIPLTPIQRWFFERQGERPHHWNQSVVLRLKDRLDVPMFTRCVRDLIEHHQALQHRYEPVDNTATKTRWQQWYRPADVEPHVLVQSIPDGEEVEIHNWMLTMMTAAQESLNIQSGPLMKVIYFTSSQRSRERVFITIHHLVVDAVSWRIIIEDLNRLYAARIANEPLPVMQRTTSYAEWATRLTRYASSLGHRERFFWLNMLAKQPPLLPVDISSEADMNVVGSTEEMIVKLDHAATKVLTTQASKLLGISVQAILLTAVSLALRDWSGHTLVQIDLEGHGREEIIDGVDLTRTVGWFTSIYPIVIEMTGSGEWMTIARHVQQQLDRIPNKGIGYGILQQLCEDEVRAQFAKLPSSQVSFNYLGQFGNTAYEEASMFQVTNEATGQFQNVDSRRSYLIDMECMVIQSELIATWIYSRNVHHRQTIEQLATIFRERLLEIVNSCHNWEIDQREKLYRPTYPLTPVQHGMVFHTLMEHSGGVYIQQLVIHLRGEVHVPLLKQAWEKVVNEHTALRLAYMWDDQDRCVQYVRERVELPFYEHTVADASEGQRLLSSIQADDRKRGFKLEDDLLMRWHFITCDDRFTLLWSYHHIVLDGWSVAIVLEQVLHTYEALLRGEVAREIRGSKFEEYVDWLSRQDERSGQSFWTDALSGYTPTLVSQHHQPLDATISASSQVERDVVVVIPAHISERIRAYARAHHVTLHTFFEVAWAYSLASLLGKEHIVFGCIVSGRSEQLERVEEMVGLMINCIPIPVRVEPSTSIQSLMKRVQQFHISASPYEHIALSTLRQWLSSLGPQPWFDTIVVNANYPLHSDSFKLSGAEVTDIAAVEETHYPLTLTVVDGDEIHLDMNVNWSEIQPDTMHKIKLLMLHFCGQLTVDPDMTVSEMHERIHPQVFVEQRDIARRPLKGNHRRRVTNG